MSVFAVIRIENYIGPAAPPCHIERRPVALGGCKTEVYRGDGPIIALRKGAV